MRPFLAPFFFTAILHAAFPLTAAILHATAYAHDNIEGFTRIRAADCSFRGSPRAPGEIHSIYVRVQEGGGKEAQVLAFSGARSPIDFNKGLDRKGTGTVHAMVGFPSNEEETVVVTLDKRMQKALGRPRLVLTSKVHNANPEMPYVAYLSNPMTEDEDIELLCYMSLESTDENLWRNNPEFVQRAEHPSVCSIEYRDQRFSQIWTHGCTATIVGKNTLLTAAHCAESFARLETRVRCGSLPSPGSAAEWKKIARWNPNAEFRPKEHAASNPNDIAIVELETEAGGPVVEMEPSRAETERLILRGEGCTHYGFGRRQDDSIGDLYRSTYQFPDEAVGGRAFVERIFEMTNMIASNPERFLRNGDSGGPILCRREDGREVVVGAHSFVSVPSILAASAMTSVNWEFLRKFLD